MAITSPFTITYGDYEVGGSTGYQLSGPYVIDKDYVQFRLVFDVMVVAESFADLHTKSDYLEEGFRSRLTAGQKVIIDLDGHGWEYTVGGNLLQVRASIAKAGNPDTDRGFSRSYTVSISGELPADQGQDGGLRSVEVSVLLSAARRKTVTMRGIYTATEAGTALQRYSLTFDSKASAYLTLIDPTATWEIVDESYSLDREQGAFEPEAHLCSFSRQYAEVIFEQSPGVLSDNAIRDHRVTFTDTITLPGDGGENIVRLQRVSASFDCSVVADLTDNLPLIWTGKIKPLLIETFREQFSPVVYGVENVRCAYDETSNRISAAIGFVYQPAGGQDLVEYSESVTYREQRNLDYTPVHESDELAFYVDPGWTTLERIWTRTMVRVGEESPEARIAGGGSGTSRSKSMAFSQKVGGISGPDSRTNAVVVRGGSGGGATAFSSSSDGWNTISNTSQMSPTFIGLPGEEQLRLSTVTETIVERYHRQPGSSSSPGLPRWRGGTP